jgi:lipooligosaccharide transport system permease protein
MATDVAVPRRGALPVLEHMLIRYRRTWQGSVLTIFVVPILFLLGVGLSVGTYVDRGGALGVPYIDFIAPGLFASTLFQLGLNESMYPVLGGFEWQRIYFAMQASPLQAPDIVLGHLLYVLVRVAMAGVGFLIAMTIFGTVHSWWALATLPFGLLLAAAATLPLMAFSATARSDSRFPVIHRLAVIPMTLFAGVFFPVAAMPVAVRWLAYVSPLWHAVELCRAATLGWPFGWAALGHIAYLGLWVAVGYELARRQFDRRLKDGGS